MRLGTPHPQSISGGWEIRADPLCQGFPGRWWEHAPADGWVPMGDVGPWQRVLELQTRGVVWYRCRLPELPETDRRIRTRHWIRFASVATECRGWVNGVPVGRHIGDFIPFDFEITSAVCNSKGSPELLVQVDQIHAPRPSPGCIREHGHITKGFHDVLGIQHGGIWGDVLLRHTGDRAIVPNGLWIDADPETGKVCAHLELSDSNEPAYLRLRILAPDGTSCVGSADWSVAPGATATSAFTRCDDCVRWTPEDPKLYTAVVDVCQLYQGALIESDHAELRFGFRDIRVGGVKSQTVLLNGRPLLIRGVLEWGHEPVHHAPAPTPDEIRCRFNELKARGFNCVCCCMVYMPEYFYSIADEMGMLVWQEHPVWKSRMGPELNPEYQRLYREFLKRDRRHPSVVIISGSCEHDAFDTELAGWWWDAAKRMAPRALHQVQTAFFAWSDPDQTDLYDEHTYDNSGRWAHYVRDVRDAIEALPNPRKPFILGETIISNAWPSERATRSACDRSEWARTRGLESCLDVEREIEQLGGSPALLRFRRQAHQHALQLRKYQCELLRHDPAIAGWVMNHMRDVPTCRCGFVDECGDWRFSEDELRPFLAEKIFLLRTPGQLRSFHAGQQGEVSIGVSNFGKTDTDPRVGVRVERDDGGSALEEFRVGVSPGEVTWHPLLLLPQECRGMHRVRIRAESTQSGTNQWDVWVFAPLPTVPNLVIADVPPFSARETELEFEERCYSSGWGLPVKSWHPRPPQPGLLAPNAPLVNLDGRLSPSSVVLSHRLTRGLLDHVVRGGAALCLASAAAGGLRAKTVMQWGLVPFVHEAGPIAHGDSAWIVDLLHIDLTAFYQRAIPTQELGLSASVMPLIRYYYTHDSGTPRILDALFAVRIGAGVLVVSSLDHTTPAGLFLASAVLRWLSAGGHGVSQIVGVEALAPWIT